MVEKREYPTSKELQSVDCVCISGSFVDDAGVDKPWIARLSGFVSNKLGRSMKAEIMSTDRISAR